MFNLEAVFKFKKIKHREIIIILIRILRAFKTLALIDFLITEKAQRSQRFKKSQAIFHSVFSVFSQNIDVKNSFYHNRFSKIFISYSNSISVLKLLLNPKQFLEVTKIVNNCLLNFILPARYLFFDMKRKICFFFFME
jgi:hypothetical protein